MDYSLNKDIPIVRLRAFRAIDDPETCNLFIEGHTQVLTNIGVTKVTSSKNEWMFNSAVFVLVIESIDGKRVYGGARVHVAGGNQPLPIEQATSALDSSVFDLVWKYAQEGTGEICGLWNSGEIAGYGVGTVFLIRTGFAITKQLGIKSLFAFCAPYTIKPVVRCGMELEKSIGDNGTFLYPKLDLVATTMLLKDINNLTKADEDYKEAIIELRENLNFVKMEEFREKKITIHYETQIPLLDKWDLNKAINEAYDSFQKAQITPEDKIDLDFL
jgi:hypothetical protein